MKEIWEMLRKVSIAAALVAAVLGAGKASALMAPFTEEFASNVSGWEDNPGSPLA